MNELDLDKLLSMEDPLPKPKLKPEPEPQSDVPVPPPVEPEPETEPEAEEKPELTKPQRTGIAVLAALILAIGFFTGYLFRATPKPVEQTTAPPLTTVPPATTAPQSTTPALPAKVIFSDPTAVCHQYQQSVETVVEGEDFCFYDGDTRYRFAGKTVGLNRTDFGYYNVWIRVELTQNGKERFSEGARLQIDRNAISLDIDWTGIYLGATPYYADDDGTVDGWLVHGWMPSHASIAFQIVDSAGKRQQLYGVSISPVVCDSNLLHFSTKMLAQLALNDRTFWRANADQLPEDLTPYPALQALSQRESSISVLMESLLKGESAEQKHALAVLKHEAFLDLMSGAERRAFYDMTDEYFSVKVCKAPMTQIQIAPPDGEAQKITYLLDSETAYRLGSPIPEPAEGEEPINFIARVELSDYYRTLYHGGWKLQAGDLRVWRYFNTEGAVAGWFVFGHLSGDTKLEFQLTDTSATNIPAYTVTRSVSPRSELIFAQSDDSDGSPDNSHWLEQKIVTQNNLLICYAYREAPLLTAVPGVSGVYLQDGPILYHLWEMPEDLAELDPSEYNVWFRVELTEEGRKKYTDPGMLWFQNDSGGMPTTVTSRLGMTAFDVTGGALEGWFIFGCAPQPTSISLQRQGININNPISFSLHAEPLWPADESVLLTTDRLADQILTNDSMWEAFGDKVPDELGERPQLYAFSRRRNVIDTLLDRYVCSPATVCPRIDLLLKHPAFLSQMTAAQIALWEQGSQSRFSFATFPQPLTEYTDSDQHFFTDGSQFWHISDSIPSVLRYLDESDFNCFIQVSLSDLCRKSGYDGWNLRARSSSIGAVLGTREYYDDTGALAGWFVYGKLSGDSDVNLWLENAQSQTVDSLCPTVSPIA